MDFISRAWETFLVFLILFFFNHLYSLEITSNHQAVVADLTIEP